jgi:cobalt/nickel transport system permease protein
MHISEGVLSPAVLAGGAALTVAGAAIGLQKIGL